MAQDQAKKDQSLDLIAEFRKVAATADFDTPTPELPPIAAPANRPPPLPVAANADSAEAKPSLTGKLPPVMPLATPKSTAGPPPPVAPAPPSAGLAVAETTPPPPSPKPLKKTAPTPEGEMPPQGQAPGKKSDRRAAKRRAALPSRDQIVANDDAPSIGGLIYALNQKPSRRPFGIAATASAGWAVITLGFAAYFWGNDIVSGAGLAAFLGRPELLTLIATLLGPIGLMFALAVIGYRAEEMRLRSSAMTEVAVRLAEPDRMAEQSVASLGQAVRRQVSFMNDAVSRALGRAGELEALVHNEVTSLERSYEENERKIRSLIQELSGERDALVNTSDKVSGTLRSLGTEVPELIEKLSSQQIKLAKIIEGASVNLTSLETAIATQAGSLENVVGERTERLQAVLSDYTAALSGSLDTRMEQIGTTIASRTGDLQVVFEEYTRALDSTIGNRAIEMDRRLGERTTEIGSQLDKRVIEIDSRLAEHANSFIERTQALDVHLVERTQALDNAFAERLRVFDDAILRSTAAIDKSVGDKTIALTSALDHHARAMGETLARQSVDLDESLLQGISAVRRTSENITRQSIKALEGLAGQSELLKNVSENLLGQINTITNRFDGQSQQIIRAANALETANYKIDKTLQSRHADLSDTLDRMSGKADELSQLTQGYTRQIEGSISEAESRTRSLTAELAQSAEERSRATIADIERLKSVATDTTTRALDDLRSRFTHVSQEVTQGLSSLTSQFTETSGDARRRTAEAAAELAAEQDRLRAQAQSLPGTTRESADAMRRVLQDHLRAIDQLSSLSQREAVSRDVARPTGPSPARPLIPIASSPPREEQTKALTTLGSALSQELQSRAAQAAPPVYAPAPSPSVAQPAPQATQPDAREGWKLGDLLKRASADDEGGHQAPPKAQTQHSAPAPSSAGQRPGLDFPAVARAIDPATAGAIWQRLGAGQRGIMVRSIYTPEGRVLFDDTLVRLQTEAGFAQTTYQYLSDFERVLQEADRQDPSGNAAQEHLRSDYGRVYLFLAHASGRIT